MKKTAGVIVSIIISLITAYPVGRWFAERYFGSGEFFIGPFRGYFAGFLLSYVFISALLLTVITARAKYGLYATLPAIIFDLLIGSIDPMLWMHLILLVLGLGIAYLILFIAKQTLATAKKL